MSDDEIDLMVNYSNSMVHPYVITDLETRTASFITDVNSSSLSVQAKDRMLAAADINQELFDLNISGPNFKRNGFPTFFLYHIPLRNSRANVT